MMESAIADKALELIAKNTSYNVINDKADMSDWTNTGATSAHRMDIMVMVPICQLQRYNV
jgi:hypothetical protein